MATQTKPDNTLSLPLGEPDRSQAPAPRAIELEVPRLYSLTVAAIEDRAAKLEKMATGLDGNRYPREVRTLKADALMLREDVLPKFKDQEELQLGTPEEVQYGLRNALQPLVHRALLWDVEEEDLTDWLVERLEPFARDLAERAYHAGYAARSDEPGLLALRALATSGADYQLPERPLRITRGGKGKENTPNLVDMAAKEGVEPPAPVTPTSLGAVAADDPEGGGAVDADGDEAWAAKGPYLVAETVGVMSEVDGHRPQGFHVVNGRGEETGGFHHQRGSAVELAAQLNREHAEDERQAEEERGFYWKRAALLTSEQVEYWYDVGPFVVKPIRPEGEAAWLVVDGSEADAAPEPGTFGNRDDARRVAALYNFDFHDAFDEESERAAHKDAPPFASEEARAQLLDVGAAAEEVGGARGGELGQDPQNTSDLHGGAGREGESARGAEQSSPAATAAAPTYERALEVIRERYPELPTDVADIDVRLRELRSIEPSKRDDVTEESRLLQQRERLIAAGAVVNGVRLGLRVDTLCDGEVVTGVIERIDANGVSVHLDAPTPNGRKALRRHFSEVTPLPDALASLAAARDEERPVRLSADDAQAMRAAVEHDVAEGAMPKKRRRKKGTGKGGEAEAH